MSKAPLYLEPTSRSGVPVDKLGHYNSVEFSNLEGYLAHKKTPTPLGPP